MSTPVGQSRAQPLQARQRSSAPRTASDCQPPVEPAGDQRPAARGRGRGSSPSRSRVAWNDGHITPPVPVLSARHLPTPVHRCTAATRSPPSWCRRRNGRSRSSGTPARRTCESSGRRVDEHPGVEEVVGVEEPLHLRRRARAPARRTSAGAARTGPGRRRARRTAMPPCSAVEPGGLLDEARGSPARPGRRLEVEVDADVHAAVAEVAVGDAVVAVLGEERVEGAEVVAEPVGRDRGVLPPRLGRAGSWRGRRGRRRPRGSARSPPARRGR